MLAGWRERGLAPSVVVDPAPAAAALAGAECRSSPGGGIPAGFAPGRRRARDQAAGSRRRPCRPIAHFRRRGVGLDHGRQDHRRHARPAGEGGRSSAPCRTPRPQCARASPSPSPGRGLPRNSARWRHAARSDRARSTGSRRKACSTRSPQCPAAARPMSSCWPRCWSRRRSSRASRPISPAGWHGRPSRLRRAARASEEDAADLRKAVTSPKGTTERALAVLMAEAWPALMSRAIAAATERSRELGG